MSKCVTHEQASNGLVNDRPSKMFLQRKELGVSFHCPNQETPGETKSYVELWPWHRHEFKNSEKFSWDIVSMKMLVGTGRPRGEIPYKLSAFRTWLDKQNYENDKDAWKTETVLKTGRLPRGMRYAVDWRYIGGIAPIANGKFKEGSIRRFTHIYPTQQCKSVCTMTAYRNVLALSRITQLGENARIKELGNSPWCPFYKLGQNKVCSPGEALSSYNYIYETDKVLNPNNPLVTWAEVKDGDNTYALNTQNHIRERKLRGIPAEEFLNVDDEIYVIREIDNNGGEELGDVIGVNDGSDIEELIDEGILNPEKDLDEEDEIEDLNPSKFSHSARRHAAYYWSEQRNDPFLFPFVDPKYQIPDGTSPVEVGKKYKNTCGMYITYQCGDVGEPWEAYRKQYGLEPFNTKFTPTPCTGDTLKLKGNYSGTFDHIPVYPSGKKFSGTNIFRQDETANPIFIGKNTGMFMAGDMWEASPFVYLMAFLDNIGPIVLSNGSIKNSSKKLNEFANRLGKTFEEYGEQILFYDHLISGYGDKDDLAAKVNAHKYTHTQNYNKVRRSKGNPGGHTWAVVGYKFLPDDPENSYIIGMNSHTLVGSGPNQRGVFILKFPFVVGVMGPNELRPLLAEWTNTALPMKYYYDGTEEVPESARGGTNEVRGYDKYDWRQTVDFDPSGESLANVGDGTDEGGHCGLGSDCSSENGGYIRRPLFSPDTSSSNSASTTVAYKQLSASRCSDARPLRTIFNIESVNSCKKICDKVIGCKLFEYYELEKKCVFFKSCDIVNSDTGTEVYDKTLYKDTNGEQTFIIDNWYHTRPNCVGTFSIPTFDEYVPIGGGCKIANTVKNTRVTLARCKKICDASKTCEIFSYELATKTCRTECTETNFEKVPTKQQNPDYMPSCGVVTYRKREPLIKNAITRQEDYLLNTYTGYINGRCHSNKLVRNVFSANLTTCMNSCDDHRFCQYFEQIGQSCFLYDECNLAPAEFGDAMYNVNVSYPDNFVAYEKQNINELLPYANYESMSQIPRIQEVSTTTFKNALDDQNLSNTGDMALVASMVTIGIIFGLFGAYRLIQNRTNYKKVTSYDFLF